MPNKWLRYMLVVVLTMTFITFLYTSCEKYLSGLVAVSTMETPQTSFNFPAVSVCGLIENVIHNVVFNDEPVKFEPWILGAEQDYIVLEDGEVNVMEGQYEYISDLDVDTENYNFGDNSKYKVWLDDLVFLSSDHGQVAACNTFQPPNDRLTPAGVRSEITLILNTKPVMRSRPYYIVAINHPDLLMPLHYLGNRLLNLPTYVLENDSINRHMIMNIDFGEYIYLTRPDRPCRSEEDIRNNVRDDFKQCYQKYVKKVVPTCMKKLPSNCTENEMKAYGNRIKSLAAMGEKKLFELINCYPPCHLPTYDLTIMPTMTSEVKPSQMPILTLSLRAPRPAKALRTEYLVYDLGGLAGDVGGMMGVLLGMSMLTMYDAMSKWFSELKKRFNL